MVNGLECSRWEYAPLGSLVDVQMGHAPPSDSYNESGDGVPLIAGASDFGTQHPNPKRFTTRPTRHCVAGDILICVRATIGTLNWADKRYCIGRGLASLRINGANRPEFIYYWLAANRSRLEGCGRGATFKTISKHHITDLPTPIVSAGEQRRIVERIDECMSLVDEIATSRADSVADYDALRFSTVSHVVSQLKECYATTTVGDLVSGDRAAMRSGPFGSAMKHGEFVDEGNLVIGIANVQENRFDPVRKWMITDEKFEEMQRYQVAPGDVLITIMGTIGRTCVVPDDIGQAITSKHVYRIRFPDDISGRFVSYIINYDFDARRQLYGTAIGGIIQGLNATKLRNLKICIPPRDVQDEAVEKLDEMHAALNESIALTQTTEVQELREAILRKAFAGEL